MQLAGGAVAHDDHETRPREDVDLAELDLLDVIEVASGVQDEEVAVVVVLDLRALVGLSSRLRRRAPAGRSGRRPHVARRVGIVQAQPDEAIVCAAVGGLVDRSADLRSGVPRPCSARSQGSRCRQTTRGDGGRYRVLTGRKLAPGRNPKRSTRASTNSALRSRPAGLMSAESHVSLGDTEFQW